MTTDETQTPNPVDNSAEFQAHATRVAAEMMAHDASGEMFGGDYQRRLNVVTQAYLRGYTDGHKEATGYAIRTLNR